MKWNKHLSIEETIEWLKFCETNQENKMVYNWGIILKKNNEPIGSIGAFVNPDEPDRYEVGYAIGKQYWGQGITTEALRCVMDYSVNNPASGAVIQHVGFRYIKDGIYKSMDDKRIFNSKVYYLDIK